MKVNRTNKEIQRAREFGRYFENKEEEMTFDWPETPEEENKKKITVDELLTKDDYAIIKEENDYEDAYESSGRIRAAGE